MRKPAGNGGVEERERRIAIIDELGALEAELAAAKPKADRAKQLREQVRAWIPKGTAPEECVTFEGKTHVALIGAAENRRSILSLREVYKRVGIARFLAACTLTLKALEELIPANELYKFTKCERTGPRDVKVLARPKQAAA